jgi:hypothetical protein
MTLRAVERGGSVRRVTYGVGVMVLGLAGWAWAQDAGAPDAEVKKTTITIGFSTRPRVRASVYHGRKRLGTTPFSIERKPNAGPLDVVVRAGGYYTVNTRAWGWKDEHITVKMTRIADGHTLFGYKAKVAPDAGPEPAASDGGVAPARPTDAAH